MTDFENSKVYAVVVTFNGQKWVDKCFGSLKKSNIPIKVIAIDNGSTDATCDLIANNFPEVKIIKSNKNLGFGKANNLGLHIARNNNADYVVLLNQDAYIGGNSIETIIKLAKKNPEFGVLSGMHLDGSGEELDLNFLKQLNLDSCPHLLSDYVLNKTKELYETSFVNAAFWVITKECMEASGFFEPLFFLYGEDDNYIHRVRYHNFKVGITPLITICHDRKDHKGQTSINLDQNKVDFLKYVLNPNKQFIRVYTNGVTRIGAKSLVFFLKFQWMKGIKTLFFFIQTLFYYRKYLIARKSY